MTWKRVTPEVYYPSTFPVQITGDAIARLKDEAKRTPRLRCRLCTHRDAEEGVQEMLIALERGTYVRPHRHLNKSESFHLIEGAVDFVLFHEDGSLDRVVPLGEYRSGLPFYHRIDDPRFHAFVIRTECLVFHEVTRGPFLRAETEFPSWAPDESDMATAADYMAGLDQRVREWLAGRKRTDT